MPVRCSVLALAAYFAGFMGVCSRAVSRLESMSGLSAKERDNFRNFAFAIFSKNKTEDPPGVNAEALRTADVMTQVCIASGELLSSGEAVKCATCGFSSLAKHIASRICCPLCHAQFAGQAGRRRR